MKSIIIIEKIRMCIAQLLTGVHTKMLFIYAHAQAHVTALANTHAHTHTQTHTHTHTYIHTRTHAHRHRHTHHTRNHTHKHTHTCSSDRSTRRRKKSGIVDTIARPPSVKRMRLSTASFILCDKITYLYVSVHCLCM